MKELISSSKAYRAFREDFRKEVPTVCEYKVYPDQRLQETMYVSPAKVKENRLESIIPPPLSISIY